MTSAASSRRSEHRAPPRQVGNESQKRAETVLGAPSSKLSVTVRSRQRTRAVNLRFLGALAQGMFNELPQVQGAELGVFLVASPEMTRLNESFLQHVGSTDVITFDYSELGTGNPERGVNLHGEILISVDEAIVQAQRFHTTWQAEVVRYVIHGVLHLVGYDDRHPAARRKMKREENRLLKSLSARFALNRLGRKSRLHP